MVSIEHNTNTYMLFPYYAFIHMCKCPKNVYAVVMSAPVYMISGINFFVFRSILHTYWLPVVYISSMFICILWTFCLCEEQQKVKELKWKIRNKTKKKKPVYGFRRIDEKDLRNVSVYTWCYEWKEWQFCISSIFLGLLFHQN